MYDAMGRRAVSCSLSVQGSIVAGWVFAVQWNLVKECPKSPDRGSELSISRGVFSCECKGLIYMENGSED